MALLVSRRGHSFSLSFSLSLTLSFELCMQWLRELRGVALRTSAVLAHASILFTVLMWCLGPGGATLEAIPVIDFFLHTYIYIFGFVLFLYLYFNASAAVSSYFGCVRRTCCTVVARVVRVWDGVRLTVAKVGGLAVGVGVAVVLVWWWVMCGWCLRVFTQLRGGGRAYITDIFGPRAAATVHDKVEEKKLLYIGAANSLRKLVIRPLQSCWALFSRSPPPSQPHLHPRPLLPDRARKGGAARRRLDWRRRRPRAS